MAGIVFGAADVTEGTGGSGASDHSVPSRRTPVLDASQAPTRVIVTLRWSAVTADPAYASGRICTSRRLNRHGGLRESPVLHDCSDRLTG